MKIGTGVEGIVMAFRGCLNGYNIGYANGCGL
jgi:hypothetical protein